MKPRIELLVQVPLHSMLSHFHQSKLPFQCSQLLLSSADELRLVSQSSPEISDLFWGNSLSWAFRNSSALAEGSSPSSHSLQVGTRPKSLAFLLQASNLYAEYPTAELCYCRAMTESSGE